MFVWIGILTVSFAIVTITFMLVKKIWIQSRKTSLVVRLILRILALITIIPITVVTILLVIAFGTVDDQSPSGQENNGLPLTSLNDPPHRFIKEDWEHVELAKLGTKIASISYGFQDIVTVDLFKADSPDMLVKEIAKAPHLKKTDTSVYYEKMLCGAGDDLILEWAVSSDNLKEFHTFCSNVFNENIETTHYEFERQEKNSSLSIRRLVKTDFFIVKHCFRCY